jgi:hypothetical protein
MSNGILGNRVFPVLAPQDTAYPLAIINITSVNPSETKTNTSWFDNIQVRIDCYGIEFQDVSTADEAIRLAIDGFRGDITLPGAFGAIPCDGLKFLNGTTEVSEEPLLFICSSFYQFRYNRYGLTGAEPGLVSYLQFFNSDSEAITGGLNNGSWYLAGAQNIYGKKYGDLTRVGEPS